MKAYDLKLAALLLALAPLAWLVPPRHFDRMARNIDRLMSPFYRADGVAKAANVEAIAGDRITPICRARITTVLRRLFLRDTMFVLRATRPGAAVPDIDIDGLDNLQSAVAAKRGVILWDAYFAQHETILVSGLFAAGYRPRIVTSDFHGFSASAFGMRVLNPIHRLAWRRYCDHIVLDRNPAAGIRAIKAALDAGEVVVMVASPWGGRATVTVRFLDGGFEIVPGPAKLAVSTGAALLPICNYLDPESGRDCLVIGAPLTAPSGTVSGDLVDGLLNEFIAWLEPAVQMQPEQWLGWSHVAAGYQGSG